VEGKKDTMQFLPIGRINHNI